MPICKIKCNLGVLTNHLILTKMKKLKLIFGLLMVSAFVAVAVLNYTSTDDTAIRKANIILPTHG